MLVAFAGENIFTFGVIDKKNLKIIDISQKLNVVNLEPIAVEL